MTAAETSHYLENQFLSATRQSRKRCRTIADDHHAKLNTLATSGFVVTLQGLWTPVYTAWNTAYNTWRNTLAARRACTQKMDNLTAELMVTPPAGGRSRLDEWEGRVAGLFGANDPLYQHFFPEGRAPFNRGGRDAVIAELLNLAARFSAKGPELAGAAMSLQSQVDALDTAGVPVPEALQDALTLALDRQETVAVLAQRVQAFHVQMAAARVDQQGREGEVSQASLATEKQRVRICRRMYANMGSLIGHHLTAELDSAAEEPQLMVAEYFQFELLKRTEAEEEPDPPAPPEPPAPPPP